MKHFKMIPVKVRDEIKNIQEATMLVNEYGRGRMTVQEYNKRVERIGRKRVPVARIVYVVAFIAVLVGGHVEAKHLQRCKHVPKIVRILRLDQ